MPSKFKNFVFVFYGDKKTLPKNHSFEDIEEQLTFTEEDEAIKYIVYGWEICPDTGRKHLQGFCQLKNMYTIKWIQKRLVGGIHMHIDKMKGTATEASTYCKKDGFYYEFGNLTEQGDRTDLQTIRERLTRGDHWVDVALECENYQQIKFTEKYKELLNLKVKRTEKPFVTWIYGPTGKGKTEYADALLPDAYWLDDNFKFWNGYECQEDIIIDDFREDMCSLQKLLKLCQKFQMRVEVKNSWRPVLAKRIIFTCNTHPGNLYGKSKEDIDQLLRRIDKIIFVDKEGVVHIEKGAD